VTVVTVTGAIDLASTSQLRSRLAAIPDRGTVVDLAGVTPLAPTGWTVLLDLHHRLHRAGAQLVLLGVPPHVRRMLDTARLDTALAMTPVVTEAVELAAANRPREASPRASQRNLRALPAPELVDPRQTHPHDQPCPGGIA
jgi:anti-anti-sigma factor